MGKLTNITKMLAIAGLASSLMVGCQKEESESDVTLSGTMSMSSSAAVSGMAGQMKASTVPTDYVLYCVTFTSPPNAGTGEFDAQGEFSVTISDAANTAIGCFINLKADNTTVATLTFETGESGGMDDGTTSSPALAGGAYKKLVINFDPVTGEATVDISAYTLADVQKDAGDLVSNLSGTWTVACKEGSADYDTCTFGGPNDGVVKSVDVFLDPITATETASGKQVAGMGVWASEAYYRECGATEGMPSGMASGLSDIIVGGTKADGTMGSLAGTFTGFYTVASQAPYNLDLAKNEIVGQKLVDLMNDSTFAGKYQGGFNLPWDNTNTCPAAGALDPTNAHHRACIVAHMDRIAQGDITVANGGCYPRADSRLWESFAGWNLDWVSQIRDAGIVLSYGAPQIKHRMTIMPMEIMSSKSVVAHDEWHNEWTRYDQTTSTNRRCVEDSKTIININLSSSTAGSGQFVETRYEQCEGDAASEPKTKVQEVTFTKVQ